MIGLGKKALFYGKNNSNMKIKSIKLPETLEIIGDEAFSQIKLVSTINLPKNVKTLGKNVFLS